MNVGIIIASTRPGRIGDQVGAWIAKYAAEHSDFTVSVSDLKELDLPIFNEAAHPRLGTYEFEHTKDWSKRVDAADAFIVVTPEYNYTMPPALLNALDYLSREWKYKPVAFVGYGGTGALRAIQTAKLIFTNLSVMPIFPAVNLAGVFRPVVETFEATEPHEKAADVMLTELAVWAKALKPMRS